MAGQRFEQALEQLALGLDLPAAPAPATPRRKRHRTRWLAAAATVLVMLGAGWFSDLPLRLQADHLSAVGELQRFDLADGSHIVLGSDSASAATSATPGGVSSCCAASSMSRPSTTRPGR